MLLSEIDDDYYIVEIYFSLLKVKAERLPVFNDLKKLDKATSDLWI